MEYIEHSLASFKGNSYLHYLVTCSMQIWRFAMMSGRQRVDTQVAVSDGKSWSPLLHY